MPKEGYKSVTIPESTYKIIKEIIKNRPELGYTNVSEFVRDAIRCKLEEIGYLKKAR